jgi:hypothetical protein
LAIAGLDNRHFGCSYLSALVPAEGFLFGFLLLSSSLNFQLGCGSRADSSLFPAIAKPLPLAVTLSDHSKNSLPLNTLCFKCVKYKNILSIFAKYRQVKN